MQASEYIEKATVYIADPAQAREVCRELEEHIREAVAEVEAQGIDPETAELVAVARMGPPEKVALDLAEAHHQHLLWRHYLAVIPLLVLLGTLFFVDDVRRTYPVIPFWLIVLAFCLLPQRSVLVRWYTTLRLDVLAKLRWVQKQPVPLVAGISTGGPSALFFWVGADITRYGSPFQPIGLSLMILMPLAVTAGALALFSKQVRAVQAAGLAAVVFALACLPTMYSLAKWDGVGAGLTLSGGYAMVAFGIGWVVDRIVARRRVVRT